MILIPNVVSCPNNVLYTIFFLQVHDPVKDRILYLDAMSLLSFNL